MRLLRLMPVLLGAAAVLAIALSGHLGSVQALADNAANATQDRSPYNLKSVQLPDGTSTVVRWNPCQKDITYRINLDGLPARQRPAASALIQKGMRKLADADGLSYRYTGETGFVPQKDAADDSPAELVIAVVGRTSTDVKMADESLGYGGVVWATWSGSHGVGAAVVRGYAILNADSFTALKDGFGRGNTDGNLLLHELGHATGLEHAGDTEEIMHAELTDGSPAGYQSGDRTALATVGAKAGCLRIPRGAGLPDLS